MKCPECGSGRIAKEYDVAKALKNGKDLMDEENTTRRCLDCFNTF